VAHDIDFLAFLSFLQGHYDMNLEHLFTQVTPKENKQAKACTCFHCESKQKQLLIIAISASQQPWARCPFVCRNVRM